MLKNYFKIAWRNLLKNRSSSLINIIGLAVGMAVAMVIGLWIWDEVSFDKDNSNYTQVAQVMQHQKLNSEISTWQGLPYPLANELRNRYGANFKHVVLASYSSAVLSVKDKNITESGIYMEPEAPNLLDLKMKRGTRADMNDPNTVLLSAATATAFFGDEDPIGKIIEVEKMPVKVTGVYNDMPANSSFRDLRFIAPWELKLNTATGIRTMQNPWGNNGFQIFVQLADHADVQTVSAKIKNAKLDNIREEEKRAMATLFLHPMNKWHLYSSFNNGVNDGGRVQFVWLFGTIGLFVLLLACINFMNLSTARSEKRAKEVGIRKAIGSIRSQLVGQFLSESILMSLTAFVIAVFLVTLALPSFNTLTEKTMVIPINSFFFWLASSGFILFTGFVAGSYPALYLSGFKPVKVLKGTFRAGRFASLPRKILVVLQFTVSVILITGTIVIFRQVLFAKNRAVGYERSGLVTIMLHGSDIHDHFPAVRNELIKSGAISDMAESGNPITAVWRSNGGMRWKGMEGGSTNDFPMSGVSADYGKTVGWQIKEGRDFSAAFRSDSAAFILNESAVKYMGFKNPIGEKVSFDDGVAFTVIGVVKDFITESPYERVRPSLFRLTGSNNWSIANIRINPTVDMHTAMSRIENVFKKYSPSQPFAYQFVDEDYARKFSDEERIGKLAGIFAALAIFISGLGLFGLASFVAEQRTREIGVRKILGASVLNVWGLLSKEFLILVTLSLFIAGPVAWYFMHNWLQHYTYHTSLTWWIFAATGIGAILITLFTVSFQAIKTALANPVKSLRTE